MSIEQILNDNFRILAETKNMIIGHVFETAYIIDRRTEKETMLGDFYGDPTCAVISLKEDWCLVGGINLVLWKQKKIFLIDISEYVHDMRQIGENRVEILTDPWSEKSAIWQMDTKTQKMDFIRIFDDYKNKEYSERIDW